MDELRGWPDKGKRRGGRKRTPRSAEALEIEDEVAAKIEELGALYPRFAAPGLVGLCQPRAHGHQRKDETGQWVAMSCPVKHWGKRPVGYNFNQEALARYEQGASAETLDEAARHMLEREGNIGWVPPVGLIVLDADDAESVAWLDAAVPKSTPRQRTANGKHFVFRLPEDATALARAGGQKDEKVKVGEAVVDLRVGGASQIVVEPSVHRTGPKYTWEKRLPSSYERVPRLPPRFVKDMVAAGALTQGKEVAAKKEGPEAVEVLAPIYSAVKKQDRHTLRLAIVGALMQNMEIKDVRPVLSALGAACDDAELKGARLKHHIEGTRRRLSAGKPVPGATKLRGLIGISAYSALWRALGLSDTVEDDDWKIEPVYSDVLETETVEFLWDGYIPKGKIGLLDGDPSVGKTTLLCSLAAIFSRKGNRLPDGAKVKKPLRTLYMSFEDDAKDTLHPRYLAAAGAPHMFGVWTRFELPQDVPRLEEAVVREKIDLIFIDPIMAALTSQSNMMHDSDIRRCLAPLSDMCNRTGATVLMVRHLTKDSKNTNLMYRGQGTIAFIGASRFSFAAAHDIQSEQRCFGVIKQNLAPMIKRPGFLYKLVNEEDLTAARVEFGDQVEDMSAWFAALGKKNMENQDFNEAVALVKYLLREAPQNRMSSTEIEENLREVCGITGRRTIDRVKKEAKVRSYKISSKWFWELVKDRRDRGNLRMVKKPTEEEQ